ncbi:uncharacterized protein LOC141535404 [Cotesia typhae]|uniref:uncharacterized protein LOC141535404 n=1 Tax=Cotesia typhae TaxID=2053667 RepID=UPI003D694BC9
MLVICPNHNHEDLTYKKDYDVNTLDKNAREIIMQIKMHHKDELRNELCNNITLNKTKNLSDVSDLEIDEIAALKMENELLRQLNTELQARNSLLDKIVENVDDIAKDPRPGIGETTDDYEDYEILVEGNLEEENENPKSLNFTGSIKKSSAMWTKDATLSLLSLYEANIEKLDHTNKKIKLWNSISLGLKSIDLQYSSDQVKWKMNALLSKYKSCFDNNSRADVIIKPLIIMMLLMR